MNRYPFIIAQGILMHSFPYYIGDSVKRARDNNAPDDTYSCDWITDHDTGKQVLEVRRLSDIQDPAVRAKIERVAARV